MPDDPDSAAKGPGLLAKAKGAITRMRSRLGLGPDWFLIPLAAVVGILAGFATLGFEAMVRGSQGLFFHRFRYGVSPRQLLTLLALPTAGGLLVGLIQRYVSRKAPSHGVLDAIEAMARRQGVMRLREGVFTAVNTSLTIGSGGSAGVEGPIVHIGSVLGSVVSQVLRIGRQQRNALVACGAAAGLASIFNAPIAGVIFVLEVMLRDFSLKTFIPVVVAAVFGVATVQSVLGHNEAMFRVPLAVQEYQVAFRELGLYLLLGALCGLAGWSFTKSLFAVERASRRVRLPMALKPAVGGLLLGVIAVVVALTFGQRIHTDGSPAFFGNGYPAIEACLNPQNYERGGGALAQLTLPFLLTMFAAKIIGTSLTLGSGGAGGVFAPSLFIGATFGGAFGLAARYLPGFGGVNPATYALVGMGGVLAGCVHCPLTAFLLAFEVTQNYQVILPVMLAAILATTTSQLLLRDSIYSLSLRERGIRWGVLSDFTLLRRLRVESVGLHEAPSVRPQEPAQRLLELVAVGAGPDFPVVDDGGRYVGLVVGDDLRTALVQREALPLMIVGELARWQIPPTNADETLDAVMAKFAGHDVESLAVVDHEKRVRGLITRTDMMRSYQGMLESTA